MKRAVAGGLAFLVVLAGAWFAWWWTHPTLFPDFEASQAMKAQPVSDAHMAAGVIFPPPHGKGAVVELRSATAHFTTNSAGAHVTFAVCHGGMIGLAARAEDYCMPTPLPATFRWTPGSRESVVLIATATKPGRVHIDHVTLSYRSGSARLWQQGNQRIAFDLRFSAT